ncbi:hypothetical protein [Gluconobacter wancherniae]|uniref:hypothetical protein n=1 Tax=Gluconobacter wancherniae TaxID=1307955 RepID=UPI001B8B4742|nr:hypothetical protein [Gluconobacter wancherniae]MBS1087474.1 hypothetical protein [Gluconobacter wancherniae]
MSENRKLKGQMLVRVSEGTLQGIRQEAEKRDLSCSAICREVLVERFGLASAEAMPVRLRQAPRPPAPEHILELVRLRESLAETCGALVMLARGSREQGFTALHGEVEKYLPLVRLQVRDIDRLKNRMLGL